MLEGLPDVWGIIMRWYWGVSMMTVARPLSAGSKVMFAVCLRSFRALASFLVMLEVVGLGWLSMWATVLRRLATAAVCNCYPSIS
jgi:hypothetical protein